LGSEYLAHTVVAIHNCYRTGIHDPFGLSLGTHDARADAFHVPTQAHDTMGLMSPEVGPNETLGDQVGVGSGNTERGEDRRGKLNQKSGGKAWSIRGQ
jgi:hypothetical protein